MAKIIVQNASLVFPLVGSDNRFGQKVGNVETQNSKIGGQIVMENGKVTGVKAIDTISISLKTGDRLGIIGHNGSGKSTLLRLLSGIYPPSSGKVHVEGKVAGMFSLNLGVNKEATGLENIRIKGLMYGLRSREIAEIIEEIAEFSELGEYLNMPVKTYSTGMVMRLMFSTASAFNPDILILDEWVSTGDSGFRDKVNERLEAMFEKTPIVIIASHNESRMKSWAKTRVKMNKGKLEIL